MERSVPAMNNNLLTVAAYEARSREVLPPSLFDPLFGRYGDPSWTTNTNNLDGFTALSLRPRVLRDVHRRNLATTVLGQSISLPIIIGPAGVQQMVHPDGELAVARAAAGANTLMALSAFSSFGIDDVLSASGSARWFQIFILRDRSLTEDVVSRAERAGFRALIVTVSNVGAPNHTPTMTIPSASTRKPTAAANFAHRDGSGPTIQELNSSIDSSVTWSDIDWLRSRTRMPLIIKGIQTVEDALLSIEHGASAVVVSNHGGRFLDHARATIQALPEVVDAVAGSAEVYVDGGIRKGPDVLKALAIGARAVLIGRAFFLGLAADGEPGVRGVLEILRQELDAAMAQCGVEDVMNVDRTIVGMAAEPSYRVVGS